MVLGGNTFKGNLHDLRFWKRSISPEAAAVIRNALLNGNETDLFDYWPVNEGNDIVDKDLTRFKHLVIANANWDIYPKVTHIPLFLALSVGSYIAFII